MQGYRRLQVRSTAEEVEAIRAEKHRLKARSFSIVVETAIRRLIADQDHRQKGLVVPPTTTARCLRRNYWIDGELAEQIDAIVVTTQYTAQMIFQAAIARLG